MNFESTRKAGFMEFSKTLDLRSLVLWGVFVTLLLSLGFLSMVVKWYSLLIFLLYVAVSFYLILKFKKGIYLCIILVTIHPVAIAISITSNWNEYLVGVPLAKIPIYAPIVLPFFGGYILSKWSRLKDFPSTPLSKAYLFLLAYGAALLFYVPNLWFSLFEYLFLALNIMLFAAVFHSVEDEREHKRIMWCWVCFAVMTGFFSLALYLIDTNAFVINYPITKYLVLDGNIKTGATTASGYITRAHAFSSTHEFGLFMNISFSIALGLLLSERDRLRRWFLLGTLVFFISMNLLTMGRGALGGLIMMFTFLVIALKPLRMRFFLFSTVFLLGLLFIIQAENIIMGAAFTRQKLNVRIFKILEKTSSMQQQAPERIRIWKEGFRLLKKSGFAGIGPGNFKYNVNTPHAHSVYFSFLFDFGIIGLGILACIGVTLMRGMLWFVKSQNTYLQYMNVSMIGGLIAIGIHSLVDFEYDSSLIWLYVSIAFATLRLVRSELATTKILAPAA